MRALQKLPTGAAETKEAPAAPDDKERCWDENENENEKELKVNLNVN